MVMKLASRKEGQEIYKAVEYKIHVNNHLEMMLTADYSQYGYQSFQECTQNYSFFNGIFIKKIEELAIDLNVPCETVIKMVNRMVRAS